MKIKNFLLVAILMIISVSLVSAQSNCNIDFSVDHGRTIKTIKNLQYDYHFTLKNSGAASAELVVLADNANENCENPDGMPNDFNIVLGNEILDQDFHPITSSIVLASGETKSLIVRLTASQDAYQEKWNCTEVTAEAVNCDAQPQKILLHTFNPNPLEQE